MWRGRGRRTRGCRAALGVTTADGRAGGRASGRGRWGEGGQGAGGGMDCCAARRRRLKEEAPQPRCRATRAKRRRPFRWAALCPPPRRARPPWRAHRGSTVRGTRMVPARWARWTRRRWRGGGWGYARAPTASRRQPPSPTPPGAPLRRRRARHPTKWGEWMARTGERGGGGGAAGGNAAAAALRVARDGGRGGGGAALRSAGGCNGGRVEGRADGFLRLGASSRHWRWGAVGRGRDLWDLAGGGPPLHSAIAGGVWAKRLAATAARDAAALRPAAPYLTDPRLYLLVCTVNRYKFQNVICGFDRGLAGRQL